MCVITLLLLTNNLSVASIAEKDERIGVDFERFFDASRGLDMDC